MTVEWNIYFDRISAFCPEGEIDGLIRMKANAPVVLNISSALSSSQTTEPPAPATPSRVPSSPPAAEPVPEEPSTEKCIQKSSQHIIDLLEGHGCTSNCPSDPVITPGIKP